MWKPEFNTSKRYYDSKGRPFGKGVWIDEKGRVVSPGNRIIDPYTGKVLQFNSDGTITTLNPKFDTNKRYVDPNGKKFGKGVWYNEWGNIIKPGKGVMYASRLNTVKQYNSDGTVTSYKRPQWAEKQMRENEIRVLQNDRKYAIPNIPEKRMEVSLPDVPNRKDFGVRGMAFSSNMLDSVAKYSNQSGLPFKSALGLVAKESTAGKEERQPGMSLWHWLGMLNTTENASYRNKANEEYIDKNSGNLMQSPTLLTSDWLQYDNPFADYFYNTDLSKRDKISKNVSDNGDFWGKVKADNNYKTFTGSPLLHAFSRYKEDPKNYNHHEKGYADDVERKGNMLVQHSPEIQQWMNANNVHAEGGELQTWDKLPMREKSAYIEVAVKNGIRNLQDIRDFYNKFIAEDFEDKTNKTYRTNTPLAEEEPLVNDEAANSFGKGGFMPSKSMQKKIASWEGASMYRDTVDPVTGRMMKKNNSFASEARGFVNALPDSIRNTVLANQELADNLYSYSYNVGAGNFKKRVVPALQRYYNGTGSVEDIQNSMWASKDRQLRGLQKRRAAEKEGVEEALAAWDKNMDALNKIIYSKGDEDVDYPDIVKAQPVETMASHIMQEPEPVVEQDPYEGYKNIVAIQNLYKQSEEPASDDMPAFMPKVYDSNAPFVARTYSTGGRLRNGGEKINIFADGGDTVNGTYKEYVTDPVNPILWNPISGDVWQKGESSKNSGLLIPETVITPRSGYINDRGQIFNTQVASVPRYSINANNNISGLTELQKDEQDSYFDKVKRNAKQLVSDKGPIGALKNMGLFPDYENPGSGDFAGIFPFFRKLGKKAKDIEKPFVSELNWNPEDWFLTRGSKKYDADDVKALESHIPEYLEIEKQAKANGTWLRMPDGSKWQGDPRSWVQLQSKAAKSLSDKIHWHGDNLGLPDMENSQRVLWGSSNPLVARSYSKTDEGVIPIALHQNATPLKVIDAEGRSWGKAYNKNGELLNTNDFAKENLKDGDFLIINNVIDPGKNFMTLRKSKFYPSDVNGGMSVKDFNKEYLRGDDVIIGNGTPRKALVGNNGNFDWKNMNMYKSLIPVIIGGAIYEGRNR